MSWKEDYWGIRKNGDDDEDDEEEDEIECERKKNEI